MKKRLLFLCSIFTSLTAGVIDKIASMPHVQYANAPLFRASQAAGMAAHLGGTVAELFGLHAESELNKKQAAYDAAAAAYAAGTLSAAEWTDVQHHFARDKHALAKKAYKSELVADGLTALGEAVGVRNNLFERSLAVGTTGFGVGAKPRTRGKQVLARAVLSVLDGLLSTVRSTPGLYYNRTQLAWTTAVQRTIWLLKNMLQYGVKKVHPRVWIARALQLISVGASFVGDARENCIDNVTADGHLQYEGISIFDEQRNPTRAFVEKRLAEGFDRTLVDNACGNVKNDPTVSCQRSARAADEYREGQTQQFLEPRPNGAKLTTLWGGRSEEEKRIGARRFYPSLGFGEGEEPNWDRLSHHKLTDKDRIRIIARHRDLWRRQQWVDENDVSATLGCTGQWLSDGDPPEACVPNGRMVSTRYCRLSGQPEPRQPNWEELKKPGNSNGFTDQEIDDMREEWRKKQRADRQQQRIKNTTQEGLDVYLDSDGAIRRFEDHTVVELAQLAADPKEAFLKAGMLDGTAPRSRLQARLLREVTSVIKWYSREHCQSPFYLDSDFKFRWLSDDKEVEGDLWNPALRDCFTIPPGADHSPGYLAAARGDILPCLAGLREQAQPELMAAIEKGSHLFFDTIGTARFVQTGYVVRKADDLMKPLQPGGSEPEFRVTSSADGGPRKIEANAEGEQLIRSVSFLMDQVEKERGLLQKFEKGLASEFLASLDKLGPSLMEAVRVWRATRR